MKYFIEVNVPLEYYEGRRRKNNNSDAIQNALKEGVYSRFRVGHSNVKAKLKLVEFNTIDNKPYQFVAEDGFTFWVDPNLEDATYHIFFDGLLD